MSLRVRLVGVVVVLVAAALVLSGLLATSLLRSYLLAQVDRQLADFAASPALMDQLLSSNGSGSASPALPAVPQGPLPRNSPRCQATSTWN